MRITVTGRQIDIGDALRAHVGGELAAVAGKYAGRATDGQVVFGRIAHEYACEATVHLSTGLTAQARAHATEIYAAFDACADKLGKQLRRYKRRLKNHHAERQDPVALFEAATYVLAADARGDDDRDDDAEPEDLTPVIVAEMATRVPSLSVGEAVMQMELAGAPVLVFRNERGGAINVVYRRDDGNVGWIDPGTAPAAAGAPLREAAGA